MSDIELVHLTRGDTLDCIHRGHIVMVGSAGEVLYERGDSIAIVFMRSLAKPFQALAVVESGAAKHFDLTSQELALMCGSHNGTPEQTTAIDNVLRRIGLDQNALQCGTSTPIDRKTAEQLTLAGQKPTTLHHPCSGKHTGMLAICRLKGWDIADYAHAHHPVQEYISGVVSTALGVLVDDFQVALDGCSVPTYGVPLQNVALGFARLGSPSDTHLTIARSMRDNPVLMSGHRRMDTALMQATHGRVIAKDGTEGVFGCSVPDRGVGLALKISDGSNRAIMPVVTKVLRDNELITAEEAEKLSTQFPLDIKIHTGERAGIVQVVI